MDQPKYAIDQQVKFSGDHDRLTGTVKEIKWDSAKGFTYYITSKFYDLESNSMVEGVKICKEDELEDMTGYTGSTEPIKPDRVVNVTDKVEDPQDTEEVTEPNITDVPADDQVS
jgi:hypothetical protein